MIAPLHAPTRDLISCSDADSQDIQPESVWISFACAALTAIVKDAKEANGPAYSERSCRSIADEAGAYANAMLHVWGEEWSVDA